MDLVCGLSTLVRKGKTSQLSDWSHGTTCRFKEELFVSLGDFCSLPTTLRSEKDWAHHVGLGLLPPRPSSELGKWTSNSWSSESDQQRCKAVSVLGISAQVRAKISREDSTEGRPNFPLGVEWRRDSATFIPCESRGGSQSLIEDGASTAPSWGLTGSRFWVYILRSFVPTGQRIRFRGGRYEQGSGTLALQSSRTWRLHLQEIGVWGPPGTNRFNIQKAWESRIPESRNYQLRDAKRRFPAIPLMWHILLLGSWSVFLDRHFGFCLGKAKSGSRRSSSWPRFSAECLEWAIECH